MLTLALMKTTKTWEEGSMLPTWEGGLATNLGRGAQNVYHATEKREHPGSPTRPTVPHIQGKITATTAERSSVTDRRHHVNFA
jgi:hypothetical protein